MTLTVPALSTLDAAINQARGIASDHPASARLTSHADDLAAARDAICDLIYADTALDVAQDVLASAKREKGSWRVKPLGHGHPAVIAVREAKERRRIALCRIMALQP